MQQATSSTHGRPARGARLGILLSLLVAGGHLSAASEQPQPATGYFGTLIGPLSSRRGAISGDVYAVDEQTLFIRAFTYDGQTPDTYFWSSASGQAAAAGDGFIVPDEKGSTKPLERYAGRDLVLRLPEGKTLREIHWLSVWSRQLRQSLADIQIPRNLLVPRPLEIAPLSQLAHGLRSGPITIVDSQTFLVPDFHYDGLGPAAFFWLSRGPGALGPVGGLKLRDENGSLNPLRRYQGETVVISLPDELTVAQFQYFGVWCTDFQTSFGQTRIPAAPRVPPSPKMLGIKPENKLNCEILYDELGFEIRWVLDGDDIVMQLVAKIEPDEYMAFGLGKDDSRGEMRNADAVVAWVDRTSGQVHATDYFLGSAKAQCQNEPSTGSCPDTKLAGGGDSLTLLHGAIVNGYSMVTFKRPQLGVDELYDQHVYSDGRQSIIWAIGQLNQRHEVGYHRLRSGQDVFIDFARNPQWNCPIPDLNASMSSQPPAALGAAASQLDSTVVGRPAGQQRSESGPRQEPVAAPAAPASPKPESEGWFVPAVVCPAERTFYAQIGPTGGQRSGRAPGRASWGVSWYINGLMAPELVLERHQVYRFVVEGGNDKTAQSRRHPLYLTDSPEGGFNYKTDEERLRERIFAGVALRQSNGQFVPTAEGRLCEWKASNQTLANPDLYPTFAAYQRSLKLDCLPGQAAILKFQPDAQTPDLIYYQCYTNRFMGWRIRVVDSCKTYLNSLGSDAARGTSGSSGSGATDPSNSKSLEAAAKFDRPSGANNKMVRRQSSPELFQLQPSEPRMSFVEAPVSMQSQRLLLDPTSASSPGTGNPSSSLDDLSQLVAAASQQQFATNDMLILNNSLLNQQPTINLSTIEQILRLSPADLEFLDDQQLDLVNALVLVSQQQQFSQQQFPSVSSADREPSNRTSTGSTVSLTSKMMPKGLQSYVRRLASIYYPVQQQLASMLSASGGKHQSSSANDTSGNTSPSRPIALGQQQLETLTGGNQNHLMQQTGGEQASAPSLSVSTASSFSLSNLVPKPKIDLSKSNISKKLNKLRIKSGRKYEPHHGGKQSTMVASASNNKQRPTPANEFNYDIFNNQLAQLERQQKQLQALENVAAAVANWRPPSHDQQHPHLHHPHNQAQLASPSQSMHVDDPSFLSNLIDEQAGPQHYQPAATFSPQSLIHTNMLQNHQQQPEHPRPHPVHLGSASQLDQPEFVVDYLSLGPPDTAGQLNQSNAPVDSQLNRQVHPPSAPNQPEAAVYIRRLPPVSQHHRHQVLNQLQIQSSQQFQRPLQQPSSPNSARYPSIQPYAPPSDRPRSQISYLDSTDYSQLSQGSTRNQASYKPHSEAQKQYHNALSSMQSFISSTHEPETSGHQGQPEDERRQIQLQKQSTMTNHLQAGQPEVVESLSGSGSGSSYYATMDSNQRYPMNSAGNQATTNNDMDHMLAIERFSKQSSERGTPSVVHPVTGQEVSLFEQSQSSQPFNADANQYQSPRLYSSLLISKQLVAPEQQNGQSVSSKGFISPQTLAETLDSEQSAQTADLRRVNASEQQALSIRYSTPDLTTSVPLTSTTQPTSTTPNSRGNVASVDESSQRSTNQMSSSNGSNSNISQLHKYFFGFGNSGPVPQATTESVPTVLIRPLNFDFFASDPPATATIISTTPSSATSPTSNAPTDQVSTNYVSGPLVSFAPLQTTTPTSINRLQQFDASSTMLPAPSSATTTTTTTTTTQPDHLNAQITSQQPSQFNFDANPFIPIELAHLQPGQRSTNNLPNSNNNENKTFRLFNTPSLIETMLGQYQNSIKSDAMSHGLTVNSAASNPVFVASDRSSMGANDNQQWSATSQSKNDSGEVTNETRKMLLSDQSDRSKVTNPMNSRADPLTAEYLITNQFKPTSVDGVGNLHYAAASEPKSPNGPAISSVQRLVGHQFDHLSSLSSPPSTSMALDPMQTASSSQTHAAASRILGRITNYSDKSKNFDLQAEHLKSINATPATSVQDRIESNLIVATGDRQLQAHQRHIPGKLIPELNLENLHRDSNQQLRDKALRLNPGGDNINTLIRDNTTDNAILSHVMAVISSNAIPTPPLVPVSSYTNADYFLPIGERPRGQLSPITN